MNATTATRPVVLDPTDRQIDRIARQANGVDLDGAPDAYVRRLSVVRFAIQVARDPMSMGQSFAEEITAPFIGGKVNQVLHLGGSKQLSKSGASALIDWLNTLPTKRTSAPTTTSRPQHNHTVPAGSYAVETDDGAINTLAFYRVDRPEEGKWAGWTFVKHVVGDTEQRLSHAASRAVLAKIAADPAAASMAYGKEIGCCGACGRTLTNDDSREAGIGPVCRAKNGW